MVSKSEEMQTEGYGIGLVEAFSFLKCNRKYIFLGGLAGLMFAVVYIGLTPKKYEASWHMKMAQYVYANKITSIEEPGALAERLRSPTTYSDEVKKICAMPVGGEFGEYLGGALKVDVIKNSSDVLAMKLTALSTEQASSCAEAIATMIIKQQRTFVEESLAGSQQQLIQYKQILKEEQADLEKLKKSEASSLGYLVKFGQLSSLRARIGSLQEEIFSSQLHPARLVSPIYVPSKSGSPKVVFVSLLGIALGLMLGLLSALIIKAWRGSRQNN